MQKMTTNRERRAIVLIRKTFRTGKFAMRMLSRFGTRRDGHTRASSVRTTDDNLVDISKAELSSSVRQ
jgi:hypothetical protein